MCVPGRTTISGSCYVSIIERLHCAILEKRRGKVSDGMLLLHNNASIHKCNIIQTAIRKAGFVELNHPGYCPDIAASDDYLFSNLNIFVCGKNFSPDDEAIDTVENHLNKLA